jgi:aryl-alcohol dehydrogenase-like predicted oxidoreductase
MIMHLRTLGSTDLIVSPLGLGLAALGRPGYINLGHTVDLAGQLDVPSMETRTHNVLDLAWQAGIRYYDVARSYGRAEEFLGTWLQARQIPVTAVTVGSKWGYTYTAAWKVQAATHEVKEHSLATLQKHWAESQAHLSSYLRLYQIHSATIESGVLENQAVLTELARLKGEGIYIGLSLSGPRQAEALQRAADIMLTGVHLFDAVQATWNLLERSATAALQEARAAGMGIIVKEALANGRLTHRNTDLAFAPKLGLLKRHAARLNTTVDALALAAALAQPWVDVVLSGAATREHLRSNLQALHVAWDEEAAVELATLVEPPEVYWETRKQLPWN